MDPAPAPPAPPARPRPLAAIALLVMFGHGIAGLLDARVPGWKMFADPRRYDYELRDRDGGAVDIERIMLVDGPRTDPTVVARAAAWLARREPARAPLRGAIVLFGADGEPRRVAFEVAPGGETAWSSRDDGPDGTSGSTRPRSR